MQQKKSGNQLEFILRGGSLRDKTNRDEIAMIGAMPAVAVRHERRRQGRRSKRPSLLFLQSLQSQSASPSPVQSPPGLYAPPPLEIYLIGKFSLLHVAVVTLLMGAVTLIVGLVQLKPGAEASEYRFILIGTGMIVTLLGITVSVIRCCLLPLVAKRRERLVEQVLQEREAEKRRILMKEVAAAPRMPRNPESEYTQHRTFVPNITTHAADPTTTTTATKSPLTDPQFTPVIKTQLTSIP